MNITIRKIEEKDYPSITSLLVNELWDNKIGDENVIPFFRKVENDENYQTFVALLNDEVVGFISTVATIWAAVDSADLLIEGFAVKKEYQGKGIGTQLLNHVEAYSKERGIYSIGLSSGFQRASSHAFYERNGYTKGSFAFHKTLSP